MKKPIKKWLYVAKKFAKSDVAIHGFWIPAFPAGMTSRFDVYTPTE